MSSNFLSRIFACATLVVLLAGSASADDLSRKWQHLFGNIGDKRSATITALHAPSGTFRVTGEFSSGERVLDTTFTVTVRVKNRNGDLSEFIMNERVPATKGGGTEVRTKSQDFLMPGVISTITAQVDPNMTNPTTVSFHPLAELSSVDICGGHVSNTSVNAAGGTAKVTECDSWSGKITSKTIILKHPIPVCPTCDEP